VALVAGTAHHCVCRHTLLVCDSPVRQPPHLLVTHTATGQASVVVFPRLSSKCHRCLTTAHSRSPPHLILYRVNPAVGTESLNVPSAKYHRTSYYVDAADISVPKYTSCWHIPAATARPAAFTCLLQGDVSDSRTLTLHLTPPGLATDCLSRCAARDVWNVVTSQPLAKVEGRETVRTAVAKLVSASSWPLGC
jgi:hypothetical protein